MTGRLEWPLTGALLALHAALAWLARAPGVFRGDDATYLVLARSLRHFRYEELFRVDLPVHRMYPPGYPTLLAIWSAIGGERFDWLVLVGIACSAGSLLLVFLAVRRCWGSAAALACLVALAFNAALIESSGWLASEAPFMLFELAALYLLTRDDRPGVAAAAGTAAIAGALTRSAGVALVASIALFWLWRGQYRRAAVFTCVAMVTVGGWLMFSAAAPEHVVGQSYLADFGHGAGKGLLHSVAERASGKSVYIERLYWQTPASFLPGTPMDNFVAMPAVAGAFVAGLTALYARWPVAALYLASYAALLLAWPWTLDRFLYPVVPLAVLTILVGARRLAMLIGSRWAPVAAMLLAALLAINGMITVAEIIRTRHGCHRGGFLPSASCIPVRYASFLDSVRYIEGHAGRDAVFVSGRASTLYYFTGRRAVSLTQALAVPPAAFPDFLRDHRVDYVLLSAVAPFSEGVPAVGGVPLARMVKANCTELRLEGLFPPSTFLFSVPAAGVSTDATAACEAADSFIATYPVESRR